jgi:hypothetical protein
VGAVGPAPPLLDEAAALFLFGAAPVVVGLVLTPAPALVVEPAAALGLFTLEPGRTGPLVGQRVGLAVGVEGMAEHRESSFGSRTGETSAGTVIGFLRSSP